MENGEEDDDDEEEEEEEEEENRKKSFKIQTSFICCIYLNLVCSTIFT